ncbi:protein phosphatase 2C domain-containing protein [Pleurocapsales cyanobacterium LEGE 06147]|nr:protein phosphatase 2C domain-containing protein [Pleurocapsales cyanobacterium LEGE 06147]
MKRAPKSKISMPKSEPIIQCSNPHCLAANALENQLCHQCRTPIVRRYLWATAEAIEDGQVEKLIGDRYFALTTRIFLDTKPGVTPSTQEEIPKQIIPYLQLFSYSPHIPQVYGQLDNTPAWLLEYGTVPTDLTGKLIYPELIPEITGVWQQATPLRQLYWLRQLIGLWRPLESKEVVSSLLNPQLLRVNGAIVQILQLQSDEAQNPSLQQLGKLWSQWIDSSSSTIQELLEQLCLRLQEGRIKTPEQIIAVLDSALERCGREYEYNYQIFTCTDSGRSRTNNEDASYPPSGTLVELTGADTSLTIVCDGVGGHEGGEIAAQETIDYLRERIGRLSFEQNQGNPKTIIDRLGKFINDANDVICQRNDSEQRQERQRMGTTLVMTLARAHEIFLTNVGDSRIYLITPTSCHQVTIDDDLASREVRLGYATYREALQYPSAGALIQALGMRESTALHPNIQHLVVDEDCVFLLCSDGLSDFDRVEQYWQLNVLPVLQQKSNITEAVTTLVKIANERNGHDNVTVALVYCQVHSKPSISKAVISWSEVGSALDRSVSWLEADSSNTSLSDTQLLETSEQQTINSTSSIRQPKLFKLLIWIFIILLGTGTLSYLVISRLNPEQEEPKESLPSLTEPQKSLPPSLYENQNFFQKDTME